MPHGKLIIVVLSGKHILINVQHAMEQENCPLDLNVSLVLEVE